MKTANVYHILYPEDRYISAEIIRGWYQDALANGEIESEPGYIENDILAMAGELDLAGIITLAKE